MSGSCAGRPAAAPRRIAVVGVCGSGKSTTAAAIAARLGIAHVELDALWHDAGWTNPSTDEFVRRVAAAIEGEEWVVDGNYADARPLVWARATHVVWLDPPRWRSTARALRRTAGRLVTRRELWNGNREQWRTLLSAEHPIRWGWAKHPVYRARYAELLADPAYVDVVAVRLRRPRETRRWLASLG